MELEQYKDFVTVKSTGLDIKHGMPIESWLELGEQLKRIDTGIHWWLGDWLNYGESNYGEKYAQALEATDYTEQGLKDIAYVASNIEKSRRRDNVSFSAHREVASLEPEQQIEVLDKVEEGGLSKIETRSLVQQVKHKVPELPDGRYGVLYADPPWRYDFSETDSRKIENKYPTMELEDICDLKVPRGDNAILFLWATAPKLIEALRVMEAWGFEYKTNAVWDKQLIGMGYWFRGQHELLLVGTRGEVKPPEETTRISSVISEKRGKHSKKPDSIYSMIESYYPNAKYLELFARNKRTGWDSWGNDERLS